MYSFFLFFFLSFFFLSFLFSPLLPFSIHTVHFSFFLLGSQRAYVDALNVLSGATSKTNKCTLIALHRIQLTATIKRYAVTSMQRHVMHLTKQGCTQLEKIPIRDRDYNLAVMKLDEAVETAEMYSKQITYYCMKNASIKMKHMQLKACCHLGLACEKIHIHEAAIEAYERAVSLSRELEPITKDRRFEIKCLMRIAIVLLNQKGSTAKKNIALSAIQYDLVMEACRRPIASSLSTKNKSKCKDITMTRLEVQLATVNSRSKTWAVLLEEDKHREIQFKYRHNLLLAEQV